jgi:polyisoprenoid-binding protein YceI
MSSVTQLEIGRTTHLALIDGCSDVVRLGANSTTLILLASSSTPPSSPPHTGAPMSLPRTTNNPTSAVRKTAPTRLVALAASTAIGLSAVVLLTIPAGAATAKAGAKCTKVGAKSATLVCTKKGTKLTWVAVVPPAATAATTSLKSTAGAETVGVEGMWKATTKSIVGYRVKETLLGQSTEATGRTSAVTGSMTIAGTKATEVALTVDLTGLASGDDRRDGQVQGRILETAKFPTASLKSIDPIAFGSVPADGAEITAKVKAALTLHGVTKTVTFDVSARRSGATIQVVGSIAINFPEYSINNPSGGPATVGDDGTLEFAVVFAR